jgi:hypothetical protein
MSHLVDRRVNSRATCIESTAGKVDKSERLWKTCNLVAFHKTASNLLKGKRWCTGLAWKGWLFYVPQHKAATDSLYCGFCRDIHLLVTHGMPLSTTDRQEHHGCHLRLQLSLYTSPYSRTRRCCLLSWRTVALLVSCSRDPAGPGPAADGHAAICGALSGWLGAGQLGACMGGVVYLCRNECTLQERHILQGRWWAGRNVGAAELVPAYGLAPVPHRRRPWWLGKGWLGAWE